MKCFNEYIVDVSQLNKNVEKIKNHLGKKVKLCAVVKANAYGAGLETICKNLSGKVDFFACASVEESEVIRSFDNKTSILVLGAVDVYSFNYVQNNDISISVGSLHFLEQIVDANIKVKIHLQVNSGLNRYGFKTISEFKKALNIILNNKNVTLEGVYSHFATKKNDVEFIKRQYLRFMQFKRIVKKSNVIFHICNSYATEMFPEYHLDMVRVGMMMYGHLPNKIQTKPIVSIKSKIVHVLKVRKGETVGYDRTFVAMKNMTVGIIPIGYADGMSRQLSNKASVLIDNVQCEIVGLVCMDVFMVNISNIDNPLGKEVVVIGDNDYSNINNYSQITKMSPYELLCSFKYNRMNYQVKTGK